MGITADIYDIYGLCSHIMKELSDLHQSVTCVTILEKEFCESLSGQSGQAVEAVRTYMSGYAESIQMTVDTLYQVFYNTLTIYQGAFSLLDSDPYAVMSEEIIGEITNAFRNTGFWLDDEMAIVGKMSRRVTGICEVEKVSADELFDSLDLFVERETAFKENLISVENSLCEVELPMLKELTDAFYQYIASFDKGGVSGVTIGAGTGISGLTNWDGLNYNPIKAGEDNTSCLDIRNHPELYDSLVNSYAYFEANAEAIEAVTPICNGVTETYVTHQKYKGGWAQIRNGVLLMLSVYGAGEAGTILGGIKGLSTGAAKAIKGISYLSAGIAGLFSISELLEGSQNISISLQKLNGQDAVNPLKSFLGEETYYKAMFASGLSSDLIGGAGAIKELVSIGREKAVGSLVDDVVDETGYGKPTGGSIYQNGNGNTSVLEEEILRSNNVSAFGEIAEGDPITYLEFQMRGSREGLTAKELEAIAKVDEKAVLDRINYDAVLELRKSSVDAINGGTEILSTPSSRLLRQNMIDIGIEVPNYPNAAHHIVAGNSPKAAEARAILQKYGIDINAPVNGVFLPMVKDVTKGAYHPSLHTNVYFEEVNSLLSGATSKQDVLDILNYISESLQNGSFTK